MSMASGDFSIQKLTVELLVFFLSFSSFSSSCDPWEHRGFGLEKGAEGRGPAQAGFHEHPKMVNLALLVRKVQKPQWLPSIERRHRRTKQEEGNLSLIEEKHGVLNHREFLYKGGKDRSHSYTLMIFLSSSISNKTKPPPTPTDIFLALKCVCVFMCVHLAPNLLFWVKLLLLKMQWPNTC